MGSELIPAGSSSNGGNIITNPQLFKRIVVGHGNLRLKINQTTAEVDSASAFWSAFDDVGASATFAAINTYTTGVDLTGSGLVFLVLGPAVVGTGSSLDVRLTVDGTVYDFAFGALPATRRIVMGSVMCGIPAVATGTDENPPGSYTSYGFSGAVSDYQSNTTAMFFDVDTFNRGGQALRFESSFKMEARCTALQSSVADQFGALYQLD